MATKGWRLWWRKRRWYERNHRLLRRWRIDRHAARGGFFIRHPVEGEVLEALDEGRLTIGEGTLLEPGCWLTLAPDARIEIGAGCFLNRNVMIAAHERVDDRRPHDVRQRLLRRRRRAPLRRPDQADHLAGLHLQGPGEIGANCWFGVNCAVTSGVSVGERCVIGANSVVTRDVRGGTIAAGAPAKPIRKIDFAALPEG